MHKHPDMRDNMIATYELQPVPDTGMLPDLIARQVDKLNELNGKIKAAIEAAEQAEKSAIAANGKSAGRGFIRDYKKAAIEELQSSGKKLAEAVQSGAKAQKISFEFQQRLADTTKYLFGLGANSIAANRIVLRELEKRLQGASVEELSELARKEVVSVVKQLKEQEDILAKQKHAIEVLATHDSRIKHAQEQTDGLEQTIRNQSAQQVELDSRQSEAISSLGEQAKTKEKLDSSQDATIKNLSVELAQLRDRLTATENASQAYRNTSDSRIAALGKAHESLRTIAMAALIMSLSCLSAAAWLLFSH